MKKPLILRRRHHLPVARRGGNRGLNDVHRVRPNQDHTKIIFLWRGIVRPDRPLLRQYKEENWEAWANPDMTNASDQEHLADGPSHLLGADVCLLVAPPRN